MYSAAWINSCSSLALASCSKKAKNHFSSINKYFRASVSSLPLTSSSSNSSILSPSCSIHGICSQLKPSSISPNASSFHQILKQSFSTKAAKAAPKAPKVPKAPRATKTSKASSSKSEVITQSETIVPEEEAAPLVLEEEAAPLPPTTPPLPFITHIVDNVEDLRQYIDDAKEATSVAFAVHHAEYGPHMNEIAGISLCYDDDFACYIPISHATPEQLKQVEEEHQKLQQENPNSPTLPAAFIPPVRHDLLEVLKELFQSPNVKKVAHNVKYHVKFLAKHNIKVINYDDVMVMSYILYCGSDYVPSFGFEEMTKAHLTSKETSLLIPQKLIVGIGRKAVPLSHVQPIIKVAEYAASKSWITKSLHNKLLGEFHDIENNFENDVNIYGRFAIKLYRTVELPLVDVLADMEMAGFLLDKKMLTDMSENYQGRMDTLLAEIKRIVGCEAPSVNLDELNVNSPKQLGELLFGEQMSLHKRYNIQVPISEKTQLPSTNNEVLQQFAAQKCKIASHILEYRALSKLHSTYAEGLLNQINPATGRVHTCFQNALTSTGRLSSVEPNLQNIPIRSEDGKAIRRAFIAREGWRILKADYSQVELRILAHIADDPVLKAAFREGKDVHTITASQVFRVPAEQVTKDMRRKAKAINFGIVYGMGKQGLAKQIDVDVKTAQEYIDMYFKQYPGIQKYMKTKQDFCVANKFVTTLFGRRCWIPEIDSTNRAKFAFAKRAAINTPIQGSSADITKIAMVRIHDALRQQKFRTQMILQVHDELVFESPEEEVPIVKPLILNLMENAYSGSIDFSVPLTVEIQDSDRWVED